mgnify:CR=1 FL=1
MFRRDGPFWEEIPALLPELPLSAQREPADAEGTGAPPSNASPMQSPNPGRRTDLIAPLTRFFYAMLAVALLAVLFGSPGSALFFLIVAAMSHVVRAAIQELAWERASAVAPAPRQRRPAPRPAAAPRARVTASR